MYAFHALFFPFSLSYNNHCHVHYRVLEPEILCVRMCLSIQVVDESCDVEAKISNYNLSQ